MDTHCQPSSKLERFGIGPQFEAPLKNEASPTRPLVEPTHTRVSPFYRYSHIRLLELQCHVLLPGLHHSHLLPCATTSPSTPLADGV